MIAPRTMRSFRTLLCPTKRHSACNTCSEAGLGLSLIMLPMAKHISENAQEPNEEARSVSMERAKCRAVRVRPDVAVESSGGVVSHSCKGICLQSDWRLALQQ